MGGLVAVESVGRDPPRRQAPGRDDRCGRAVDR